MPEILIELDERGRASLKAHGGKPGARYIAEFDSDGTIHLFPARVMTEAEARMWQHKPAVAAFLSTEDDDLSEGAEYGPGAGV